MSTNYYVSTGRKIGDFFIGLVGTLGLAWLLLMLGSRGHSGMAGTVWMLGGTVWIVGVIMMFAAERRFLAIGMLCALLIPLLAIGACFAIFASGSRL